MAVAPCACLFTGGLFQKSATAEELDLGARLVGSYIREAKLVGSCIGSYQKGKLVGSCTTILQK